MCEEIAELQMRKYLLFYNLKRLAFDVKPELLCPNDQHMILINKESLGIFNE